MINPAAIGGRPGQGMTAPPQARMSVKQITVTAAGGVTADGQMDHMNFAEKPKTAVVKKAAAKKNVFFSDSDESDEQDSKP